MIMLDYMAYYAVGLGLGLICCFFGWGLGSSHYFFDEALNVDSE